jgi:hypothetical protein
MDHQTRKPLARLDQKRKKKGSNQEWMSSSDPDAQITTVNDARTHLAPKAEHAVDLTSGLLVAVTLQLAKRRGYDSHPQNVGGGAGNGTRHQWVGKGTGSGG